MSHPTSSSELLAGSAAAGDVAAARALGTDGGAATASRVPCSNTGRKITDDHPMQGDEASTDGPAKTRSPQGFEVDAEWVELFARGTRPILVKTPLPYESGASNAALVDWLAFTVRSPESEDHEWVMRELQELGLLGCIEELNGGYAGYAHKAQYADNKTRLCLIAWGGKNQAATIYVSFTGHGCARIENWRLVRAWLEQHKATITRLDLAYDDFQAERVSITRAIDWYLAGGFGAGGRMPGHSLHGDWLLGNQSRKGRTLEIGSREGGKLCRIYEKGKQLGDSESPWVRVEVEWHNESRHIPYEALTSPGKFLAGAYECLHFLDQEQSRIQTQQRAAMVSFDYAMYNGRRLVGKLVNLALDVNGGDYAEVVEQLRRDGYPARVEPYIHAVGNRLEILAEMSDTPHLTRGERSI
jgi:phage replication initiation protein